MVQSRLPAVGVYLVTHDGCNCHTSTPQPCATPQEVGLYLWGKDVVHHTVFVGETPYRFTTGDLACIEAVLTLYPPLLVRELLPLSITRWSLWARSWCRGRGWGEDVVCVIGDTREEPWPV